MKVSFNLLSDGNGVLATKNVKIKKYLQENNIQTRALNQLEPVIGAFEIYAKKNGVKLEIDKASKLMGNGYETSAIPDNGIVLRAFDKHSKIEMPMYIDAAAKSYPVSITRKGNGKYNSVINRDDNFISAAFRAFESLVKFLKHNKILDNSASMLKAE